MKSKMLGRAAVIKKEDTNEKQNVCKRGFYQKCKG